MASRLALLAFLLMLSSAAAGARWAVRASGDAVASAGAGASTLLVPQADATSGSQHILWNAALWLFGLGLAVTLGHGRAQQPVVE